MTDRKEVEGKLKKKRVERAKAQYKNIQIPSFTWRKADDDFVLVECNKAAEVISQGRILKFLSKRAVEVFPHAPEILENMSRCFTERSSIKQEIYRQFDFISKKKIIFILPILMCLPIMSCFISRTSLEKKKLVG